MHDQCNRSVQLSILVKQDGLLTQPEDGALITFAGRSLQEVLWTALGFVDLVQLFSDSSSRRVLCKVIEVLMCLKCFNLALCKRKRCISSS